MEKKAGFEGGKDDPDIGWIDGKDNGDETQYSGGGSGASKEQIRFQIMEELVQYEKVLTWELEILDVESSVLEMKNSIAKMKEL